ncbi:SNF2 domain-containing protein CLASSY 3 [Striga hermonthica]|uniref:SNF2 domain-containing protein CLASSY 3 n=1 Tax=Striga hermonthica TaxID=68872 RepID=A0A9N7NEL0_STRHE|nr:SNF2 domain-containing protein CLASSY 3 [Striga hermonthica]
MRPRTRNQWDHHYRNLFSANVKKKKKTKTPNDYGGEKHGLVILGKKNIAHAGPSVKRGRGRPRKIENVNSIKCDDDSIDLEVDRITGKRCRGVPPAPPLDDSLVDLTETTSEEEDFSDEDYSESSTDSDPDERAGENAKIIIIKKGNVEKVNIEEESDDRGSPSPIRPFNLNTKSQNFVPHINDNQEFIDVRGNIRKGGKIECGAEQERDLEIVDADGEKFSGINKSARHKPLAGLPRDNRSHLSSYGCVLKDRRDGGNSVSSRAKRHKLGSDESFKNKPLVDAGGGHLEDAVERNPRFTLSKKKNSRATNQDLIEILVDSINSNSANEYDQCYGKKNEFTVPGLPLRFRFEDEVEPPRDKPDWEKEIDSLFCALDIGLLESEIDRASSCVNDDNLTEIDESRAGCCARGQHVPILDEQIGIICKYCLIVVLEIKHVLPPFYTRPPGRHKWKDPDDPARYCVDEIHLHRSGFNKPPRGSISRNRGTVWDLIPGVENEMYPHQREGFEFMWNNIAGGIVIEKMKQPLSGGRGCIISHAPGTGKTRLAIVFLQSFLKLYPSCKPVIIAPKGMLLTWESEFLKWKVDIPFHNLNRKDLSENEQAFAAHVLVRAGKGSGPMSIDCIRLTKLASWVSETSILGISYHVFKNLARGNGGGVAGQIQKVLLEYPGLLVLDEGHTPRNDDSQIWKALSKVATERRIILSGTPFQNNLAELYNTLCIVNPRFANGIDSPNARVRGRKRRLVEKKKWVEFAGGSIGLRKLREMLGPFVHVHKGSILEESLPGLRDTLVFLRPTEEQRVLLEDSARIKNIFNKIHQVSLVSVHPSGSGVKTTFVMKLIQLADALGERVLIFSQYLKPLMFIKKQIKSRFSWQEEREILYMDGQLDEKHRQNSISSFNDERSKAKVLLASERACSEGINLVGASRVVLLDTVWNPSVEKQAVSRAYRLGQKRIVHVYRLFTSGTEVTQYAHQIHKDRISHLLFSSTERGENLGCELGPYEDRILQAMLHQEGFAHIFDKVIYQPKESDLINIFGPELGVCSV